MIIMLKNNADSKKVDSLIDSLKQQGLNINISKGYYSTVLGVIGDTSVIDINKLSAFDFVEKVARVSEPFKKANRKFHQDDTIVKVNEKGFGGGLFGVIAGPCSVESEKQIVQIANSVKKSGATFLRGGAFKPRTSPYSFQGMGKNGIDLLLFAKKETGLPIVTEIMSESQLDCFTDVDVIQVGARNMQNFSLLKELGKLDKPILLKRGLSSTIEELLMSAEYIMAGGNKNIILCERGIRTFERYTRNTLDISAVPIVKKLSHLPIIVDPSHACGISELVFPMSKAAAVSGADGIMVEVHNDPVNALSDGNQSITPAQFDSLMINIKQLIKIENKVL
jgi:3-deoxy-7-phosphoheptulonate synthase